MTAYEGILSSLPDEKKQYFDLEIEQAFLGCLLSDNRIYDEVCDIVTEDSFYASSHQEIYANISGKIKSGNVASATTVYSSFENDKEIILAGGARKYFSVLLSSFYTVRNAPEYANRIRELYLRRSIKNAIDNAQYILSSDKPVFESLSDIKGIFEKIADAGGELPISSFESWEETKKEIESAVNGKSGIVPTGFKAIDYYLKGYRKGALYVLAAKTGMGKTAFSLNLAANALKHGQVMFFSMEMTRQQLDKRIASRLTGIPTDRMDEGKLSQEEMRSLFSLQLDKNLMYYDFSQPDAGTILNLCRKFVRQQKNPKLIIIDYLGLIRGDYRLQKVHQIEEITKSLKQTALKFGVPILLLCQMSRQSDHREDKRPQLSDLRDSGAIEQDADVVMFIHREEMTTKSAPDRWKGESDDKYNIRLAEHLERQEQSKGKAEVLIRKNRHGSTGVAELCFDGSKQEFTE